MKAVCWNGKKDIRVENVPDPKILNPHDAIVRISSTAICGSDLHLYDGIIPGMEAGDIIGHEFMGEVIETGKEVRSTRIGDRVIVPFCIACGQCYFCQHGETAYCDNSNPNYVLPEKLYGFSPGGYYGYSHMFGGYAGGQAEYVRVSFADANCFKMPEGTKDEHLLFLTDIFPTGYQAAENGNIQPGDIVAVWGCGPVGQFTIRSAFMLGAARVIAIDRVPERLEMARIGGAEVLNFEGADVIQALKEMTAGRGPDVCIDAVGLEAHGTSLDALMDRAGFMLKFNRDMAHVLRQTIQACRKGGTVSIPSVYGAFVNAFPMGAAFGKGLNLKMGQTNVHKYVNPLLERIQREEIDPAFVITHTFNLDQAPEAYKIFQGREDGCIKVVLKP